MQLRREHAADAGHTVDERRCERECERKPVQPGTGIP
jgi:hypothetical protein